MDKQTKSVTPSENERSALEPFAVDAGGCSCLETCMGVFIIRCGLQSQDHLRDTGHRFHNVNGMAFYLCRYGSVGFWVEGLQPWLKSSERRVKPHFLPPYAPHLNLIERLWRVMHKRVTIVTTPHSTNSQKQF
jgi:hypothetical protein